MEAVGGDQAVQIQILKEVNSKKNGKPVHRVIETGLDTTAEACRDVRLARSSYYCNSTMSTARIEISKKQIVRLSQDHPRYRYGRVTAMLRRDG